MADEPFIALDPSSTHPDLTGYCIAYRSGDRIIIDDAGQLTEEQWNKIIDIYGKATLSVPDHVGVLHTNVHNLNLFNPDFRIVETWFSHEMTYERPSRRAARRARGRTKAQRRASQH